MNLNQLKELCLSNNIEPDTIDWHSMPNDINPVDWLKNEYGLSFKDYDGMAKEQKATMQEMEKSRYSDINNFINKKEVIPLNLNSLFDIPKIIGIVADQNTGKSNLIYYLIYRLKSSFKCQIVSYGLRNKINGVKEVFSIDEFEQVRNSIVFIDEFDALFNLENRKIARQIEHTIRLIFHNNNILVLCGLGENFKKFISAKIHTLIFKKVTFADLINGSRTKNIVMSYNGNERGANSISLPKNQAIIFNGSYEKIEIPYLKEFDTKKENVQILCCKKNVPNNVPNFVIEKQEVKT